MSYWGAPPADRCALARLNEDFGPTPAIDNTAGVPYKCDMIFLAALVILGSGLAVCAGERSQGGTLHSGAGSPVVYLCHEVPDDSISIDASLDEKAWQRATPMDNFQTAGPNPLPAKYSSRTRLLWSTNHLFLAFECKIDAIRSTLTERDSDIWNGECAELYLCPRGAEAKYYEIDFNPQNAIYDSLLSSYKYLEQAKHGRAWALRYNARILSKTSIQRDSNGAVTGWTLEAAIPFADLAEAEHVPPKPGDLWWFNAFRIAQIDATNCEYSAWMPTWADFHKPWMFPRLQFVAAD